MGWATVKSEYEKKKKCKKLVMHKPWQKPVLGRMSPVGIPGSKAENCVVLEAAVVGRSMASVYGMDASQRLGDREI
jgi:hypothetical protein